MEMGRGGKGEREEWGRPPALLPPTGFCLKYHPVQYIIYLVLDLLGSCPSTFPRLHLLTLFIHIWRDRGFFHTACRRDCRHAVSSLTRIWCMDILDISTSACCCWAWSLTFDLWHKRLSISMQQTAAAAIAVCAHVNCLRLISVTCETVCSCISIQRQHVCAPVSRILIPLYNAAYASDTLYMRPLTSGSPSQALGLVHLYNKTFLNK